MMFLARETEVRVWYGCMHCSALTRVGTGCVINVHRRDMRNRLAHRKERRERVLEQCTLHGGTGSAEW